MPLSLNLQEKDMWGHRESLILNFLKYLSYNLCMVNRYDCIIIRGYL